MCWFFPHTDSISRQRHRTLSPWFAAIPRKPCAASRSWLGVHPDSLARRASLCARLRGILFIVVTCTPTPADPQPRKES